MSGNNTIILSRLVIDIPSHMLIFKPETVVRAYYWVWE